MSNVPIIGQQKSKEEDGTLFDESSQEFMLENLMGHGHVEVVAQKDEQGDYPVVKFLYENGGKTMKFALSRDQLAAITFALARQDQQSKLLNAKFREYKEVPVRLIIKAQKDIKAGELVVVWRKERVPVEFDYTYEKSNKQFSLK